ncbi:hypothetical protein AB0L33_24285 [Streptomyces sp. NPDC052299]|uniref:hypothetical protein n=1 Tax=Streptomyces sp. NPDC052299 TaxID=3155054 RepID=UPI00342630EB
MIQTLPLALPRTLVDHHRLDLTALYSTGWGLSLFDLAGASNGEVYALYGVSRYTYGVDDEEPDPQTANFGYRIITRYSEEGEILAGAQFRTDGPDEEDSGVADGGDIGLCVLPDGVLAITATPDNTTLLAPDLSRILAVYGSKDGRPYREFTPGEGDPFAGSISVTPSGRLLCTLAEYGVWRYGNVLTNQRGWILPWTWRSPPSTSPRSSSPSARSSPGATSWPKHAGTCWRPCAAARSPTAWTTPSPTGPCSATPGATQLPSPAVGRRHRTG